jgi:signal transduction histidine kinase
MQEAAEKMKNEERYCGLCNKYFRSKKDLYAHMRWKHQVEVKVVDKRDEQLEKIYEEIEKIREIIRNYLRFGKFELGECSICKEPLKWDLTKREDAELLRKAIKRYRVCHATCQKEE